MHFNRLSFIRGIVYTIGLSLAACGGGDYTTISTTPWTKQLGAAGTYTYGNAVATDLSGNVYVGGATLGGLDGNTLAGTTDFFLTKYNSSGGRSYTNQLGATAAATFGYAVATDSNGNVYVAGQTYGGLDGNTRTGTSDFFLTKYGASGTKVYTRQLGVAGAATSGCAVATDASGNVYVSGYTYGGLDGNTLTGAIDFFLTKYNSSGTKLYTKQLGVAGAATYGYAVATDSSGNVYVSGYTNGGLDGNTLKGTTDFFLTKYDAVGTKLYTKLLGAAGADTRGSAVATDANGNVYVSGWTNGGLDGNSLTGWADFFLTQYDASGTRVYTRQLGIPGKETYGRAAATDAIGNVYVSGETYGGLDGNTLTGTTDFFLTKYDASGSKLFTRQLGVAGGDTRGLAVATDASRNVYVGGVTNGGLDGNTLTGLVDFFLAKYDSSGNK